MYNYLVAYDIFDKKRLPKIKKIVYSYSLGGQKSALEAPLDKSLIRELMKNVGDIMEEDDRLNIIKVIGKPILLGKAQHIPYEKNGIIIL